MNIISQLFGSSLGKKLIMAVTGALMFAFVVAHLLGNLQIFLGREVLNTYGEFLQSKPELIWPARIGLLVLVFLHVWSAVRLSAENRAARPVGYAGSPAPVVASYASRTMLMSGLIIGAFIIFHLLHYTVQMQAINLTGEDFRMLHDLKGRHDVYRMVVLGFSKPLVSGFYVLAMALLCLHLSHGLSAMFQSIGWKSRTYAPFIDRFARVASLLIFLGYASIPVAVLAGIVK
ncbi:MAG TPA: succinate dehydrogenase cytochrome b subunit [Verrucomicrobiae bacterium]|nr:succinate dehydrogenase cytochrome b subunit [Verrucomicrobiae bacterium]